MQDNGEVPYGEMLGTFSLAIGAAVRAVWPKKLLLTFVLIWAFTSFCKLDKGCECADLVVVVYANPCVYSLL